MYKVGDKVRIIGEYHNHGFKIGEIVTVRSIGDHGIESCENEEDYWFLGDCDVEPVGEGS